MIAKKTHQAVDPSANVHCDRKLHDYLTTVPSFACILACRPRLSYSKYASAGIGESASYFWAVRGSGLACQGGREGPGREFGDASDSPEIKLQVDWNRDKSCFPICASSFSLRNTYLICAPCLSASPHSPTCTLALYLRFPFPHLILFHDAASSTSTPAAQEDQDIQGEAI